ncbi:MAG: PAS domain-containing sensor histidine kinase, partial [Bacteroidota bacterium]
VLTIRDISSQQEELKRVSDNNQFLESINKNINEAIYRSIDGEGLVYVNEAFIKMFGYKDVSDIMNLNAIHLYKNAEDRALLSDELVKAGFVSNREMEFKRQDGSFFWGAISSIKTFGENGTIYFDGAIRDITDRKEFEQELKRQAQMQSLLIKISTRYINLPLQKVESSIQESLKELGEFVGADRARIFDIDFNKGTWSNSFEWCKEGIKSQKENSQELPLKIIRDVIDLYVEGKSYRLNDTSKVENREHRYFLKKQGIKSLIAVPIMAGKYCVGFVGFNSVDLYHTYRQQDISLLKVFAELMVNIHTRMQSESEMTKLLDTANDQNKRLKDFSYITSHNMRSSVANLMGLISVIEEQPGNMEYIDMLRITTKKLSEVINNINELLNFEHEISISRRGECDLAEIIQSVLELHVAEIVEKGVSISRSMADDLKVEGYTAYFKSIFQNLIVNALKFGVTETSRKIEIIGEKVNGKVKITIKDYGLGIDLEKFKHKIFRLGARFHAKKNQGQGLGLFMTKHQVQAMGGKIEVESKVDVGTSFNVYFNGKKSSENTIS